MILEDYLSPVRESLLAPFGEKNAHSQQLFHHLKIHTELDGIPDLQDIKVAIVGVMDDRGTPNNKGSQNAPDAVREYLYPLFAGKWDAPIADLGNIYAGESQNDTLEAIRETGYQLLKKQIIPIIIGGGQDLTYGLYRAYDRMEQTVNMAAIDCKFDLGRQDETLNAHNFLSHIILKKPYLLFNFSNLGYQTYFANQEEIDLMERMFFDIHRLGSFKNNIAEAEPILRDTDVVSFDISAIRAADAAGNGNASPNGFSGEDACALSRYSGISDKVSSFGIFEINPEKDQNRQTAHLAAQMIWYFLEGYNARRGDYPVADKQDYQKFTVLLDEGDHELIFYKSHLSGRWWIEVPIQDSLLAGKERHKLIPCSAADYEKATENELPIRWWQAMKKGM